MRMQQHASASDACPAPCTPWAPPPTAPRRLPAPPLPAHLQPVGWPDRITLFLDGAAYPLPDTQTAALADSLSALTPGYTWRFMLQQPAYPGKQPEVPAMDAAPSPAPGPASSAAAAAAAAVAAPAPAGALLVPAPGPSPASLEAADLAQRVSVDPLPQNNLGGRRRLRQAASPTAGAAAGDLPLAAKGQCYSVRHVLAPDEAACVAYCDVQVAAGEVDPADLKPRFYDCREAGACPTGEHGGRRRGRRDERSVVEGGDACWARCARGLQTRGLHPARGCISGRHHSVRRPTPLLTLDNACHPCRHQLLPLRV